MRKILVVDDNVSFLKQVGALLEDSYELFLAKSGAQGLKISAQERPDMILLDIEMPEMDGFATLAKFREDPRFSAIPIVFLSGNRDEATRKRALESGAAEIIIKPAGRDFLLERIEFYLQQAAGTAINGTV
jgi:CheY-like chemotaxis protein